MANRCGPCQPSSAWGNIMPSTHRVPVPPHVCSCSAFGCICLHSGGPGYMDVILPPPGFSIWDLPTNKLKTTGERELRGNKEHILDNIDNCGNAACGINLCNRVRAPLPACMHACMHAAPSVHSPHLPSWVCTPFGSYITCLLTVLKVWYHWYHACASPVTVLA